MGWSQSVNSDEAVSHTNVKSVWGGHSRSFLRKRLAEQFLNQSHLDRAEMTRQGYWVQPGSTPTAPDGLMETTALV